MVKGSVARARLALAGGVLCLTFSAFYVRWANAPGAITSFYRMAIASALLLPMFARSVKANGWPRWSALLFPVLGGVFTALDHAAWSTALQTISVANATILNYIAPVWVGVFVWLVWRQRLAAGFWLGLGCALGGVALVLGLSPASFEGGSLQGNILGVLSSGAYAAYFIFTQAGRARMNSVQYVWVVAASAAVTLLVVNLAVGNPLTGYSPLSWAVFAGAALTSQVAGYLFIAYSLGTLPASTVSTTMIAQPVLTALLAIPLLGEPLAPAQWAGGVGVILGVWLVNREIRATE